MTTWVLVFWMFFGISGEFMKVEVHGLVSEQSCQRIAGWYVPGTAGNVGAGGAKWQCVQEGDE